jgi:hypothetical protein
MVGVVSLQSGRSMVRGVYAVVCGGCGPPLGSAILNSVNNVQPFNTVALLAIESKALGKGLEVLGLSLAIVDVDHIERIRVFDAENIRVDPNNGPYQTLAMIFFGLDWRHTVFLMQFFQFEYILSLKPPIIVELIVVSYRC